MSGRREVLSNARADGHQGPQRFDDGRTRASKTGSTGQPWPHASKGRVVVASKLWELGDRLSRVPGQRRDMPDNEVAIQILDGIAAAIFGVVPVLVIADLTKGTIRFNLTLGAVTTAVGIGNSQL
jgi:hypothetical protein